MKIVKLLFANLIFLLIFSFISYVLQGTTSIVGTLLTIFHPPSAYAQVVGCPAPGYCLPSADACDAAGMTPYAICDATDASMCCEPPTCAVTTSCSGYVAPGNTCYGNNAVDTCLHTNSNCSQYYTYSYETINNCGGPGVCEGGKCIPWCNAGNSYGACGNIGTNTTCSANNAYEKCTYTTYSGGGTCIQDACANKVCTFNSCTEPSWGCVAGKCIEYFTISGNITDVDGNGTPSIPINCAGHGSSGGAYTFGYNDLIVKGSYTCAESLPANYIAIGVTSQGVTVGPNKAGVNFTVARVFSISGTITDVDGNGTPSIPVTCDGHSASGGPYTLPYSDHIRKGSYACTIALPANYIAIGPTSVTATVGGTTDATNINFTVARVFSISGTITDVDGNGTPSIPVTCDGHSASGGPYTLPYSDHIRKGSYACTIALPANYIAIGPTSVTATVGGTTDATNINFTVARVFSISGTITDVDGNGTPNITVTCDGHSASGGPYTLPYSDHIRKGSYACTIALPANYIAIGPTSVTATVGGTTDATNINFTVAEVFSITGTITDVDGNGTPAIPVTCTDSGPGGAGGTLTGGNFTFPYGDHFRRGNVTCTLALPANYIAINPNPATIAFAVGPDKTGVNFGVARVFSIAGQVTDSLNGNVGVPNIQVQTAGCVTQTDGAGNYLLPYACHLRSINSPFTVSVVLPATYTNTGVTSQSVTVGPDRTGINFTITKLFTITGDVFLDYSIDMLQDTNPYTGLPEPNYAVRPVLQAQEALPPLSNDALTITTNANGTYTIANLITGNVSVSYLSLPTDYYMTTPRNGPPATYQVYPGFGCNTNGSPGANCVNDPGPGGGQDITDLNFGIVDVYPWVQTVCGDIRDNSGFTNREYYNDSAIITNGSCLPTASSISGVVYTGDGVASFGRGNASSTGQVVGGFNYPEVYDNTGSQELMSYTDLSAKAQTAGVTETNLSSVCNITSCTLPANLTHGIYVANGDVTLNGYTFPANQDYVFLINGNLTITGDLIVPTGSSAVFAVSGNIIVPATVGSAADSSNPNLEGVFSTEQSFIVQNTGAYCTDLRLNIAGSVIINAGNTGGTLENDRNLCLNDAWYPTIQVTQRMDFLLHMPEFIREEKIVSHELTP